MRRMMARVVEWLSAHELLVLSSGFVLAVSSWLFLVMMGLVITGQTQGLDDWILRALRTPGDATRPIGPSWVADVARDVTALGSTEILWLATIGVAGFLALDRRYRATGFVLVAVCSGWGLSFALKDLFQRARPTVVPHLMAAHFSSFPSGHSMMSAVVYFTLGTLLASLVVRRRLKFYFLIVAAVLSGLVGISRLILGVHYPSDVIAGWAAGLAWAMLCWAVEQHLSRLGAIEESL